MASAPSGAGQPASGSPGRPSGPSLDCKLLEQTSSSRSPCTISTSFGCAPDGTTLWASHGCRGTFRCGARTVWCPAREGMGNSSCSCAPASRPDAARAWSTCLGHGDLDDPAALAALVRARRSPRGDLAIFLFGATQTIASQLNLGLDRGVLLLEVLASGWHTLYVAPDAPCSPASARSCVYEAGSLPLPWRFLWPHPSVRTWGCCRRQP